MGLGFLIQQKDVMLPIENMMKRFGNIGTQKTTELLFPSQLSLLFHTASRILAWVFVIQDEGCAKNKAKQNTTGQSLQFENKKVWENDNPIKIKQALKL